MTVISKFFGGKNKKPYEPVFVKENEIEIIKSSALKEYYIYTRQF
ncbi:MAG TPA: hypothetical protein PLS66_06180 [Tepiditoga sp.]|nr:hypothetical protein [Tepiditoga sp.]